MVKDWTKLHKKYKGMWVALDHDEVTVLGFGKKIQEAVKSAAEKGFSDPIVTRIPEELSAYVGFL